MSLTRKQCRSFAVASIGALAVWAGGLGCATPSVIKTAMPVGEQPAADEAQDLRIWRRSVATIHSGATETWTTRWYYTPNPDNAPVVDFAADSVMEVVQTMTLPIAMIPDYPSRKVVYCGDVLPASYNAMPPLPPEPAFSSGVPDPDPLAAPGAPVLPPLPLIPVERPPLIVETEIVKPATKPSANARRKLATAPTTKPSSK